MAGQLQANTTRCFNTGQARNLLVQVRPSQVSVSTRLIHRASQQCRATNGRSGCAELERTGETKRPPKPHQLHNEAHLHLIHKVT
eukprot:scaffold55637_cov22-Tisochrysis_lutea.AAC.1